jgi:hypothetical protein
MLQVYVQILLMTTKFEWNIFLGYVHLNAAQDISVWLG